jgi:colanic acid/amylovoran biosynthesis protein
MPKILITNANISWNKGSAAQVVSVVCSLKRFIPDVEFTLLSYCPQLDSSYRSRIGINVVGFSGKKHQKHETLLLLHSFHLLLTTLRCALYSFLNTINLSTNSLATNDEHTRVYAEADLILDLSGDSFSDWQNRSIVNVLALLPAILLKKPFVFFSQSIGPFNFWALPFARFCLDNSNLIVIREEVTKHYLECINVKNRSLFLAGDCAYLLKPAPLARVLEILQECHILRQQRPLIGISISAFMMDHFFKGQGADYLSVMSKIVDYLVESKSAYVVLIPHSISPSYYVNDDTYAIRGVYRLVKNKRQVRIVGNDYDARELKGIIGFCDFFIGCRMHANIAAISQNIPTVALGWSHKYYGIMKRVGMEEYVINLENLSFEELKAKINMLFSMREQTRKRLTVETRKERNSALSAIKLVVDLLSLGQED